MVYLCSSPESFLLDSELIILLGIEKVSIMIQFYSFGQKSMEEKGQKN